MNKKNKEKQSGNLKDTLQQTVNTEKSEEINSVSNEDSINEEISTTEKISTIIHSNSFSDLLAENQTSLKFYQDAALFSEIKPEDCTIKVVSVINFIKSVEYNSSNDCLKIVLSWR